LTVRDHVPSEVEEHLEVGAFMDPVCEKLLVAREEGFWEEKESYNKGETGDDGTDVEIPFPAFSCSQKSAN
jgi:hypothetical protein